MGEAERDRATVSAAEVYDRCFVPALFAQWGPIVSEIAELEAGHRVLDVACGTGALATAAAQRVGPSGAVIGLDPSEEMLAVARRKPARVEWQSGRAESMSFPTASFDRVVSQFGFMFFDDKAAALREMMRVLRPDGLLVVTVCDAIDHSPGYAVLAELLHRLFGHDVAEAFRAPFALGDRERLRGFSREAGIADATVERRDGIVRFDSIESLVATERACAWTLGGLLDHAQFDRLLTEAEESLRPFAAAGSEVEFVMPALVVRARKPGR